MAHEGVHKIIYLLLPNLFFSPITDLVSRCYTSTPRMDEVAIVCPLAHNNSDAHGRVIYVEVVVRSRRWHQSYLFVFIKQANGLSQYYQPLPPGRHTTVGATVGLMQVMLTPNHLSPFAYS
jgi:hypothetical protein